MNNIRKCATALVLGLVMCLALCSTGAFAQSAFRFHHVSATAVAVADNFNLGGFGGFGGGFGGFGGGFGGFGGCGCGGGFGGFGSTTAVAHVGVTGVGFGGW